MEGFEDFKNKEVIGVDGQGRLLVEHKTEGGKKVVPYKQFIGPLGNVVVAPDPPDTSVDQSNGRPAKVPVAERWRGVDQT